MDLSIVIVNWKVSKLVSDLLVSIATGTKGLRYELFVIDNASDDNLDWTIEVFRRAHPDVVISVIMNELNRGFAAACNQGLKLAKGRHAVLLNPDTRVGNGSLEHVVRWLDQHPDVAVAGPRLLNADWTVQPSVRRLPTPIDQLFVLLKLYRLMPWLPPVHRYFHGDFDYAKTDHSHVEQVMGAAFFIRGEVLNTVGLLDERFFIWFEEVDYCKRVIDAGWKVAYVPTAEIVHLGGESFAQAMTIKKQRYFTDSMLEYFRKHRGETVALMLAIPALIGLGLASLASLLKSTHKKQ